MVTLKVVMLVVGPVLFQTDGQVKVTYEVPYNTVAQCLHMEKEIYRNRPAFEDTSGMVIESTECVGSESATRKFM